MSVVHSYSPSGRVNFDWLREAVDILVRDIMTWVVSGVVAFGILLLVELALEVIFILPVVLLQKGHSSSTSIPVAAYAMMVPMMLILLAVEMYLFAGFLIMANKAVRNEPISIGNLFGGGPFFLKLFGYYVIFGGLSALAGVACYFPAFMVMFLLMPGILLIVEGEDIATALRRSYDSTKKQVWLGGLFCLVLALLLPMVTVATCLLGSLVIIPFICIIAALMRRDMISGARQGEFVVPGFNVPTEAWPPVPTMPEQPTFRSTLTEQSEQSNMSPHDQSEDVSGHTEE